MDKQIYTQELKKEIAQKVAEEYVKHLDFNDHALMRVGSTSVAKDLIVHVKSEHFLE